MHINLEKWKITNKKNTGILDLDIQLPHICFFFCVQLVKEISCKFYYQIHRSLLMIPILRHVDTVHMLPSFSLGSFLISPHLCLSLWSCLFPPDFPTKTLYTFLFSIKCAASLHYTILSRIPLPFSSLDSNWEVASIPWILSSLNFCMNEIFVTVICHIFRGLTRHFYIVICPTFL